jgi:hypothetical protein
MTHWKEKKQEPLPTPCPLETNKAAMDPHESIKGSDAWNPRHGITIDHPDTKAGKERRGKTNALCTATYTHIKSHHHICHKKL